jgi:hypothetical protein
VYVDAATEVVLAAVGAAVIGGTVPVAIPSKGIAYACMPFVVIGRENVWEMLSFPYCVIRIAAPDVGRFV